MKLSLRLAVAVLALSGAGAVFAQSLPPYVWTSADGQTMRLRNSSGAIATISMPRAAPGVPDGNGGLGLRAVQTIDVGSSRIPLTLKRAVTVGNLARGAMFAARAIGPLALVGLVYEGVRYVSDTGEWVKPGPGGCVQVETVTEANLPRGGCVYVEGSPGTYIIHRAEISYVHCPAVGVNLSGEGWNLDGFMDRGSGTADCRYDGHWWKSSTVLPEVDEEPASDDDLIISFQQGLIANPGKAGDVAQSVSGAGHADKLSPGSLGVEGPAQVQGPTTTTTTNTPAGTETTVSNTVYNITYQGDTVNIDASVTTTTTHPDGSVTTSTTTTSGSPSPAEQTGPEESEEAGAIVDPELPPIPELYERKYPEGIVGVWNDKREGLEQSPFFQLIGKLAPSNLGDGGCPSWSLPLSLESWAPYGTHTLQVPCWVWTAIRALMIVGALLIARRLIFGG